MPRGPARPALALARIVAVALLLTSAGAAADRPRFRLPPSKPRGAALALPDRPPAERDRRIVTFTDRWRPDRGRPHVSRYVVDERIARIADGRRHLTSLHVTAADVSPPPEAWDGDPPSGHYLRSDDRTMVGDVVEELCFTADHDLGRLEHQALHDLATEEDNLDRLLSAVRARPMQVGETRDTHAWTSHIIATALHRLPDAGGLARYQLVDRDGDRRATIAVEPATGRPVTSRLEVAASVLDLAFRYPE